MKTINLDSEHLDARQLIDLLINLKTEEEPVILRNGLTYLDKNAWFQFLKSQCHFSEDRRHFNDDHELTEANWWEISYQPTKATSYAFSNTRQPLHCDNAWFAKPADINFFCMAQQASSGGAQTIYPLSRLIDDLASKAPGLLDALSSTEVVIKKGDSEDCNRTRIITLSDNSAPKIAWNYYRTEKPDAEISAMCEAFFQFLEKQEATSSVSRLQANTGDCFAFNDAKLLHGREAFAASAPFDRVLYQSMWNSR